MGLPSACSPECSTGQLKEADAHLLVQQVTDDNPQPPQVTGNPQPPPWKLPPLPEFDPGIGTWVKLPCDAAYPDEASAYVAAPVEQDEPAPALLFLSGNGHINDREDFLEGGADLLLRNDAIHRSFFVIAPKPSTSNGLVAYTDRWTLEWSIDAVWAFFTATLRQLGSQKVDVTRLYVTGISLGAAAAWHLAIKYGQHLAAVVPIAGRCAWPDQTWPRNSEPAEGLRERLRSVPLRAYHIDIDSRAGKPDKDMEWLTYGEEEDSQELALPGLEPDTTIEVRVRQWPGTSSLHSEDGATTLLAPWELYLAKGPLKDWSWWDHKGGDNHCLWWRVYTKEDWGLATFLLRHQIQVANAWSFDDKPLCVNTADQKRKLEEDWQAHKAAKLVTN